MLPRTRRVVVVATLLPSVLAAQGVVVQSTADMHFYGSLGTVMGLAAKFGGGKMHDVHTTMSVAGHKMSRASENDVTIIDADAGNLTSIDNEKKTYFMITFDQMAAAMQQAAQAAQQNAQQAKADAAKTASPKDSKAGKDDVTFNYTVAVDRPGQHEKIAGYDAERVFLTITLEAEAKPDGQNSEQAGTMVFLLDQWRSTSAPQLAALEEFQRAYMQKVGDSFRPAVKGLQAAFATDPRIKTGFEAAGKEMAKVPGVSLRSVTSVAVVPPGMKFDRQLVLNDETVAANAPAAKTDDKPKGGGFRGLMGALKSAAENADKKSADKSTEKTDQQLKQATLLSLKDEVNSITRGAVPPGAFEIPAGYRQLKGPMTPPTQH
jgi:hypothetical protein